MVVVACGLCLPVVSGCCGDACVFSKCDCGCIALVVVLLFDAFNKCGCFEGCVCRGCGHVVVSTVILALWLMPSTVCIYIYISIYIYIYIYIYMYLCVCAVAVHLGPWTKNM